MKYCLFCFLKNLSYKMKKEVVQSNAYFFDQMILIIFGKIVSWLMAVLNNQNFRRYFRFVSPNFKLGKETYL